VLDSQGVVEEVRPQMTDAQQVTLDVEAMLGRAKSLLQSGDFDAAITQCEALLSAEPNNKDALYICIVGLRYKRRYDRALGLIETLLKIDPAYARAYQEQGHCYRDQGENGRALAGYQNAVAYNSALVASWKMICEIHRSAGRDEPAEFAQAQYDYLTSLPAELLSVSSFLEEGRLLKAEKLCRAFLQANGHHVEAMRLLADIGTRFNAFDEAEFLLESCLVFEPNALNAHLDYIKVLRRRQKYEKALEEATALRCKAPYDHQIEMLFANENLAVGNFDAALDVYQKLASEAPNNPGISLTLGHALKTVGRQNDAIEAYTHAFTVKPDFGDAYWSLANLKTYRFDAAQIASMREREASPATQLADRYHLCFALGKALEDQGEYEDSFLYYERGNRLKREEVGYDWRRITAEIDRQIEHTTPTLFADKAGFGHLARDPIFILGLPRAGSTLLEQILASHSQVEGTMELPNILALAHKLGGRRRIDEEPEYPANLVELTAEECAEYGAAFIKDTMIHRKEGTPFFIDKMPNNFRHIGLIHLILPNAKIIDARRSAMGCCFSGFKQLFAEGQEFTYGLEEVGHYYSDYVRLMDHWDRLLPGKMLLMRYEEVVDDLETQVRRLLDFCGLPFEEACLNFHQTERAVRTASSEQVRQPLYRSGVDQWENYSAYLDPLRAVLGPELVGR
jgi:tetratricopeptide (TPR) repeat protein